MKYNHKLRRTAISSVIATVVLGSISTSAMAEVKFGALYPLSGGLALLGEESYRGLELAVDQINENGGVQGETVVLETGDAVDNNQAIGEARRLISQEDVKAIFGTYSSSRSIAASQVAEMSKVPYFELGAVADDVTERGLSYVFRTNPTAYHMAETIIDMLVNSIASELEVDPAELRIGIIHEDSNYGSSVAKHQRTFAEQEGLNIVMEEHYPASIVDMSSIILSLKNEEVDVVLQTSYQDDSVLFLRQANERDYQPKAIIGGGGGYSMTPTAEAVGHDVIDGVFDVDFTQYNVNPDFAPGIEDFQAAYEEKYEEAPRSGHSLINYAGALELLRAIDAGNGFSADEIKKAVLAMDVPDGETAAGMGIKIGENNQNERASMMGMQWQDGELVTVYPEEASVADIRTHQ
ncbi:amino acid-binding protein [Vreelandella sulfidaeris]|uniref:Amino acid-binding protein n=2 Tax=Vreelandella TaxID=3137766 RepID=A0A365TID6_9GAMM|nr:MULTISPECIES: ABC transporter substrate-binding protein [Halomonas]NVF15484.1 ABC transporter substrate-binding protein [Halomonas maris]RBI65054.1 amino acid-binding protein [Halomonas sulfidaeris]